MSFNRYFYIAVTISTFPLHAMEIEKDSYYTLANMPLEMQLQIYNSLTNKDLSNASLTCNDMYNTIKPLLHTRKKIVRLDQITLLQLLEKQYTTMPQLRHLQFANAIKNLQQDKNYQILIPFKRDIANIAWKLDQDKTACTFVAHTPGTFTLFHVLLNKDLTIEMVNLHDTSMVYMPYFDSNNNPSVIDIYKNSGNKIISEAVSLSSHEESKKQRMIFIDDTNALYSLAHMKKYPRLLAQCGIAAHTNNSENTVICSIDDIHIPGLFTSCKEKLTHIFAYPKMNSILDFNYETILDWAHFYYACGNINQTINCFNILSAKSRKRDPCLSYHSIINNGDLQSLFNTCIHNRSYKPYEKFLDASYGLNQIKNNKELVLSIHHNPDNKYKTMDICSIPLTPFGQNILNETSVSFDSAYTIIDVDTFIQGWAEIKTRAALLLKNHINNKEQVTLHIIKSPSPDAFPKDSEYKKTYGIPSKYTAKDIHFIGKNELCVTLQSKKKPREISTLIINTETNKKEITTKKLKNKKYV